MLNNYICKLHNKSHDSCGHINCISRLWFILICNFNYYSTVTPAFRWKAVISFLLLQLVALLIIATALSQNKILTAYGCCLIIQMLIAIAADYFDVFSLIILCEVTAFIILIVLFYTINTSCINLQQKVPLLHIVLLFSMVVTTFSYELTSLYCMCGETITPSVNNLLLLSQALVFDSNYILIFFIYATISLILFFTVASLNISKGLVNNELELSKLILNKRYQNTKARDAVSQQIIISKKRSFFHYRNK